MRIKGKNRHRRRQELVHDQEKMLKLILVAQKFAWVFSKMLRKNSKFLINPI